MFEVELYNIYRDLGIGIASIIVIIGFARWISIKAFDQIEKANVSLQITNAKFVDFAEKSLNQNTEKLTELTACLEKHIASKDDAIEMIKAKDKTINELFEIIKTANKEQYNNRQ